MLHRVSTKLETAVLRVNM